jgi:hypothetical protein
MKKSNRTFAVIENAGHTRQYVAKSGLRGLTAAVAWKDDHYDQEESEWLNVAIALELPNGEFHYEY